MSNKMDSAKEREILKRIRRDNIITWVFITFIPWWLALSLPCAVFLHTSFYLPNTV